MNRRRRTKATIRLIERWPKPSSRLAAQLRIAGAAPSRDELRDAARGFGMVTLRDAGMSAAYEGSTTLDEVIRETVMDA